MPTAILYYLSLFLCVNLLHSCFPEKVAPIQNLPTLSKSGTAAQEARKIEIVVENPANAAEQFIEEAAPPPPLPPPIPLVPPIFSELPCEDSDDDEVCDVDDVCPGFDDLIDGDNDGSPLGCDCDDDNEDVFPGEPCASDSNDCTKDKCDEDLSGECLHTPVSSGSSCGDPSYTECTNPDTCDDDGNCLDNHEPSQTPCGDDGTECVIQDTCDGMGECTDNGYQPASDACPDQS